MGILCYVTLCYLTLSWPRLLSYRNQSIDLRSKSMDWFLYDNGLRHERVNVALSELPFCDGDWLVYTQPKQTHQVYST